METLHSKEDVEKSIKDSFLKPIVFFKHSNGCFISTQVLKDIKELDERKDVKIVSVIVQDNREVSDYITKVLHTDHETPQVIIIFKGTYVTSFSHYEITKESINVQLDNLIA